MADVDWPFLDTFKPQISGFQVSAPSMVRRSEMEDGPDRVRRTAHRRPWRFQAEIDIGLAELAVFRRWYEEEIDAGRLWFNLNAWVDDAYRVIEARIVAGGDAAFSARLIDQAFYRLSFTYEVRELPRLDDQMFFQAIVGGAAVWSQLVSELDIAVNTEIAAAAA